MTRTNFSTRSKEIRRLRAREFKESLPEFGHSG